MMIGTVIVSLAIAIALFMLLPAFIAGLLEHVTKSNALIAVAEGVLRLVIFLAYVVLISLMKDIKRVFMYHGAEHKCINCIEHGMALTVDNVRASSKEHKRCGTSFIFLVMFISVIFFIFIRMPNPFLQIAVRVLLVPVIAGVSYEVIRWAGSSDSKAVMIVSKPGLWLQKLTTREPDDSMIEVGIKAVEAVFDWKEFLDEYYDGVPDDQIPPEAFYYEDEDGTAYSEAEINATADDDGQEAEELDAEGYLEDEVMDEAEAAYEDESGENDDEPEDYESDESDDGIEMLDDDYEPDDADETDADEADADTDEADSDSDDDKQDSDGIEFVDDEEEEEEIGIEMPIFKQRHTEVGRDDR